MQRTGAYKAVHILDLEQWKRTSSNVGNIFNFGFDKYCFTKKLLLISRCMSILCNHNMKHRSFKWGSGCFVPNTWPKYSVYSVKLLNFGMNRSRLSFKRTFITGTSFWFFFFNYRFIKVESRPIMGLNQ